MFLNGWIPPIKNNSLKTGLNKIPLTQSQQLIYAGQRLNPNSPLYNVPYVFRIHGPIDTDRFNRAFQLLISRFDALRTSIEDDGQQVHQLIRPDIDFKPAFIDWRESPPSEDLDSWLEERGKRIFDLARPLFDCVLITLGDNESIWYLNLHHLITDATSLNLLYHAMEEIYRTDGKANNSLDYKPFADYVVYESESMQARNKDSIDQYWKDNIAEYGKPFHYYGNNIKPLNTNSERTVVTIASERAEHIRKRAQQPPFGMISQHLAIYNIFASALALTVHSAGGTQSFAIGSPVHNRDNRDRNRTVGLLMEVFPLFLKIGKEDAVADVIKELKTSIFQMLGKVGAGMANAEIGRSFNTMLNYIPWDFGRFDGHRVEADWLHPGHCDPNHVLRCQILDPGKGEMQLIFDFNCEVFPESKRKLLPVHCQNALKAILLADDTPVQEVELIDEEERGMLMRKFKPRKDHADKADFMSSFEKNVELSGSSIALIQDGEGMSYTSLNRKANMLSNYLLSKGIQFEDRVGLYMTRSTDYIISLIALMKIGAVFVPIPSDIPMRRVQFMLKNSDCRCCLSHGSIDYQHIKEIPVVDLDSDQNEILSYSDANPPSIQSPRKIAYHLYTSGSTGLPKGVIIEVKALNNYLNWAAAHYQIEQDTVFPLFTSIGFDLTISSTFLPLMKGGTLHIYKEAMGGPDLSLFKVLSDNAVNTIKLTPSHIGMIHDRDLGNSQIRTIIVGGELFKTELAKSLSGAFKDKASIFNEYGPTEATVGCIAYKYEAEDVEGYSVPIGLPITNMRAYVLNDKLKVLPGGVVGELFLSGESLAYGYHNLPEMTKEKFLDDPFRPGSKMYRTGDLARWNEKGQLEFKGREDEQVKFNGYRVELTDIESNLTKLNKISDAAVVLIGSDSSGAQSDIENCARCGLPSNYPNADFDREGICHLCNAFDGYKERVNTYFKTEDDLRDILMSAKNSERKYDCLSLLSGGKDSTYVLARLVGMGLKVLAFTLDNGYISDQAKENVDKIVAKLGVDHVYGETEHMNKIFVDSLHRHANVCNGCFKTIYTLSTQVALEKNIPFVVTGLSRGQFFETRLTEELFWEQDRNSERIDSTILEARKLYHREKDAISEFLDVSMFHDDKTFNKVQFIDFYRYSNVSLQELLSYLKEKIDWKRPTDTGRSTNCLINQLGIYVHKKEKGYSNYAFPYSWDVRLGHKQRDESLEEINEEIDEPQVKKIMREIGYTESVSQLENSDRLVAYYVSSEDIAQRDIRTFLQESLPAYMIPGLFKRLEAMPLTTNGKTDKNSLRSLNKAQLDADVPYTAPRNDIEILLSEIWCDVLQMKKVGVFDDFITLGGHSLSAIRITARINEELQLNFPLNKIFDLPTIAEYSSYIEKILLELMDEENE